MHPHILQDLPEFFFHTFDLKTKLEVVTQCVFGDIWKLDQPKRGLSGVDASHKQQNLFHFNPFLAIPLALPLIGDTSQN